MLVASRWRGWTWHWSKNEGRSRVCCNKNPSYCALGGVASAGRLERMRLSKNRKARAGVTVAAVGPNASCQHPQQTAEQPNRWNSIEERERLSSVLLPGENVLFLLYRKTRLQQASRSEWEREANRSRGANHITCAAAHVSFLFLCPCLNYIGSRVCLSFSLLDWPTIALAE